MKRIGYIYQKIKEPENIRKAILTAAKGKKYRGAVKTVLADLDRHVGIIRDILDSKTYTPCEVRERDVYEGSRRKKRHITTIAFFPDQVIHWCIINQIKNILVRRSYGLSCGSMPNRGAHYARKFIRRWLIEDPAHTAYCAKLDISRFYPSIPHSVVKSELAKLFKDKDLLDLLYKVIGHWSQTVSVDGDAIGLPIGFLTSQWLANMVLTPVDYVIKQKCGISYYVRYMDDMLLFGSSSSELHEAVKTVDTELWNRGFRLKKNWQVFRTDSRPIDCMGFRFYRDRITLRRALMLRISRNIAKIKHKYAPTVTQAKSVMSYMGWIKHSDSYGFFKKFITRRISIKRARRIISRFDKENCNHDTVSF